jgi:hypothetical protein
MPSAKEPNMNPLNDPTPNQAQLFSARLGELAANSPQALPLQPTATPDSRLHTILAHFFARSQAREHAVHKLKLNELAAPE